MNKNQKCLNSIEAALDALIFEKFFHGEVMLCWHSHKITFI